MASVTEARHTKGILQNPIFMVSNSSRQKQNSASGSREKGSYCFKDRVSVLDDGYLKMRMSDSGTTD